ncbi:MAG: hypothetical protein J6P49_04175 [Paludibacteraceae bacterium]|nr:hypothetical protein [Paludibacteraceae bacterium]MBO7337608.1 hypothetical protein [Paludibacteraceae bacterium]MBP5137248.1 hypothetical protein [Paludibacteraceae bacterium]MBP5742567.1 hypothetical protein [Paludibacteraceae bacterium]
MKSSYSSDRHYLERLIEPNLSSVMLIFGLSIVLWLLGYAFQPQEVWNCEPSSPIDCLISERVDSMSFSGYFLGWVSVLAVAVMLFALNERDNMISQRTILPIFFYVLLMGANVNAQSFVTSSVSNVFVLLAMHNVFSGYRQFYPVRSTFNMGAYLALASLFCEEYLLLLPFFCLGMLRLNTLSLRTFFAGLLGLLAVYSLLFGSMYLIDDEFALTVYEEYASFFYVPAPEYEVNVLILLFYGAQSVCLLFAVMSIFSRNYVDNMKGSKLLGVVIMLLIGAILMFHLFTNKMPSFYPLLAMLESILFAHYFTLHKSMFSRIIFLTLACSATLYFLNAIIFQ